MFRHWRYRLEKGRPHLILLVGLLSLITVISVVGGLLVYALGAGETASGSIWWTFLHISDPGYLGDDDNPRTAVLGTIFTVLGMVTFMAGLVGILTSLITSALIGLREGGAPISFRGHIVIVGWNARIFTLVTDLLEADEKHQIAILAELDKSNAERQLEKRVFSRIEHARDARAARVARGQVVYRTGSPSVPHDLERIAAAYAHRYILLAPAASMSIQAADVFQIRNLYSIERSHTEGERQGERFSTVVELASDELRSHAFFSLRINPRLDAWVARNEQQIEREGSRSYLPTPKGSPSKNDLTVVNTEQIVSRIIAQCTIQPFLSSVYEELFSFRHKELILWQPDRHWHEVWDRIRELPPEQRVLFLARHCPEGMVVGRIRQGEVSFNPADWDSIDAATRYIVLGDRRRWSDNGPAGNDDTFSDTANIKLETRTPPDLFRVLVLGINRHFPQVVQQFSSYLEQYENTHLILDVVVRQGESPPPVDCNAIKIHVREAEFTEWEVMGRLLESDPSYNSILLMAEDVALDDPEVDSRVTLALVMLRAFRDDAAWSDRLQDINLIAEVRDPKNRNILQQVQMAGDVIVGDEYVSGFIAQVCLDHELEEVCREILDYGDYEIYAHRIAAGSGSVNFASLIQTAANCGEVAIGFLRRTDDDQMLPVLAPDLETELQPEDLPLVIARD